MAFIGSGLGCVRRSLPAHARFFRATCPAMKLQKGDSIPAEVELMKLEGGSPTPIKAGDVFNGKKVALVTVPGALTPTCQNSHVPDWVAAADDIKSKGVDEIVCISVNDPFVMSAFEKQVNGAGKITFLGDGGAEFATKTGIDIDTGSFGGVRTMRGSYLVEDGKFTQVNIEEGKTSYDGASKPETVLGQL